MNGHIRDNPVSLKNKGGCSRRLQQSKPCPCLGLNWRIFMLFKKYSNMWKMIISFHCSLPTYVVDCENIVLKNHRRKLEYFMQKGNGFHSGWSSLMLCGWSITATYSFNYTLICFKHTLNGVYWCGLFCWILISEFAQEQTGLLILRS